MLFWTDEYYLSICCIWEPIADILHDWGSKEHWFLVDEANDTATQPWGIKGAKVLPINGYGATLHIIEPDDNHMCTHHIKYRLNMISN